MSTNYEIPGDKIKTQMELEDGSRFSLVYADIPIGFTVELSSVLEINIEYQADNEEERMGKQMDEVGVIFGKYSSRIFGLSTASSSTSNALVDLRTTLDTLILETERLGPLMIYQAIKEGLDLDKERPEWFFGS